MTNISGDYDLVVRGGTIVDGTGAPAYRGDVAVVGDHVVAVGDVDGNGRREIDAEGKVVAPGFVDAHSHMDAQVLWEEVGASACWHGVTTTVMGNCGFTVAPARPDARELVVRNLERAEDIPGSAMAQGFTWTWSTFAEYLDTLDATPKGINYAGSIGHSALRTWAMGERAWEGACTEDDLEVMARELRDALQAGAMGFSTSRSRAHETSDNRPVASRLAERDEVTALVEIVGRESNGVFQLAHERHSDPEKQDQYWAWLAQLSIDFGVPIASGHFATDALIQPSFDYIESIDARGGDMWALTHCRGIVSAQSFRTRLGFDRLPEWAEVRSLPEDAQRAKLLDPEVRARLVHAAHHGDYGHHVGVEPSKPHYDTMTILLTPYLPNPTVAEEAARRGVDPVECMIDVALEHDFEVFFLENIVRQDDDERLIRELRHPKAAMGFSDSGAHISQIFDWSIYSHLLAYWVREREALSVEEAINMITLRPATLWRLHDRGRLTPGCAADITVFDPATVGPQMPIARADLPGGARRIEQRATGFAATIVNGEVLTLDGEPTEARPGRVLRRAGAGAAS
jgi:N-acyl-D-aspartate/D-glutamate deacylase